MHCLIVPPAFPKDDITVLALLLVRVEAATSASAERAL